MSLLDKAKRLYQRRTEPEWVTDAKHDITRYIKSAAKSGDSYVLYWPEEFTDTDGIKAIALWLTGEGLAVEYNKEQQRFIISGWAQ